MTDGITGDGTEDIGAIWTSLRSERLASGRHVVYAQTMIGGKEHKLQVECQNLAFGEKGLQEQVAEPAVVRERGKVQADDTIAKRAARRKTRLSDGGT